MIAKGLIRATGDHDDKTRRALGVLGGTGLARANRRCFLDCASKPWGTSYVRSLTLPAWFQVFRVIERWAPLGCNRNVLTILVRFLWLPVRKRDGAVGTGEVFRIVTFASDRQLRYADEMALVEFGTGELVIHSPGCASRRLALTQERYSLGRSSTNDLPFPQDQKLSRVHLVFERSGDVWTVRDLGSRNGTFVNGLQLAEARRLADGDQIMAGHLHMQFEMRDKAGEAEPGEITFVEEEQACAVPTVSVNLKSALATSSGGSGRSKLDGGHLAALVRAGRELAGRGRLPELFSLVLDLSLTTAGASRGVVMTCEGEQEYKIQAVQGEGLRISTGVRDLVVNEGRSVLIRDTQLDGELGLRESIVSQEIRSILAVPLQTDEHVMGLLYLDSPQLVREFSAEDLNVVTVMANIAAIRIEHARLVEEEQTRKLLARDLERAAEIQRRLLPSNAPEIDGFELAGYNVPCRTVGGDYYDFLPYADGRVGIFLGDVSGKGLGAALLMSNLQACVHLLFEAPTPLDALLGRLNRSLAANCPGNAFITLFAAVLDPVSGELVYCNAGHNAPLLVRAAGGVELLNATGVPLGILRQASYEQKSCRLQTGDVLVLFSDGVTEACAAGSDEEFGEERLVNIVRQGNDCPAAELLNAVTGELSSFLRETPPADDMTLAVVRRC